MIRRKSFAGLCVGLLLLAPAAAGAAVLATGAAYKGATQGAIFCIGTNVGTKPIAEMSVRLIDLAGNVVASETCAPGPGEVCQASTTISSHCEIEFKGSKRAVRGSLSVNSAVGNNIEVVEPAR